MNFTLFHCAPVLLGADSVILPGNWGRIKRLFETDAASIARETILENIRRSEFPDKPSRLDGAFACATLEIAQQYREKNAPANLIYKVELVDHTALCHNGDYDLVMQGYSGISEMEVLSRRYWGGEILQSKEILTLSPLRVIECIEYSAQS